MERITSFGSLVAALDEAIDQQKEIDLRSIRLGQPELVQLQDSFGSLATGDVESKLKSWGGLKSDESPITRLVARQMRKVGLGGRPDSTTNEGERRRQLIGWATQFLKELPIPKTPPEWEPTPTPPELVLNRDTLDNARDKIELFSEESGSVSRQLLDPIELSITGLVLTARPNDSWEEVKHGFDVPQTLLDILQSLKYPESEEVFQTWLKDQFSETNPWPDNGKATVHFLQALVNFASFLDSSTHLDNWKPLVQLPDRSDEVLLQPFHALDRSVGSAVKSLSDFPFKTDTILKQIEQLKEVKALIGERYSEVLKGTFLTSRYTADLKAMTPTDESFAQYVSPIILSHQAGGSDPDRTARGVINMAESAGVSNVWPIISSADLKEHRAFIDAFVLEAQKQGLIDYPEAVVTALDELKRHPFKDALDLDYSKIIKPNISNLYFYFFPGTNGPFHRGHRHSDEIILESFHSQKKADEARGIQRLLVAMPVTNIEGVAGYNKSVAQVGPLLYRLAVMLLSLSDPERFRRDEMLITTSSQPELTQTSDIVGRIWHTYHQISARITASGIVMPFRPHIKICYGSDELEWKRERRTDPRILAPRSSQRDKILQEGGFLLARRGWLSATSREYESLRKETGVDDVIFDPSNPDSHSTVMIKEGDMSAVAPAARWLAEIVWSQQAINQRIETPVPHQHFSAGEVNEMLINGQLIRRAAQLERSMEKIS